MWTTQLLLLSLFAFSHAYYCRSDKECESTNPRSYCYASGECVACLDCSLHRRKTGGQTCARSRNDCGPCLTGLSAEDNIDGSLGVCVPTTTTPTKELEIETDTPSGIEDTPSGLSLDIPHIAIGIIGAVILVFVVWKLISYLHRRDCCARLINNRLCESILTSSRGAPPPYTTTKSPSAPPYDLPSISPPAPPIIPSETQNANPYMTPIYVSNGHLSQTGINDGPDDEVQEPIRDETDEPLISHQETQPSAWMPHAITQDAQPPRTSFANILSDRTSELRISQPLTQQNNTSPQSPNPSRTQFSFHPSNNQMTFVTNVQVMNIACANTNSNRGCSHGTEETISEETSMATDVCVTSPGTSS